jgi:methyl-accepting chemotaxis protein
MKLKTKMTIGSSLIMVIPVIVISAVLGWIAVGDGRTALEQQAQNQLISVRNATSASVERTFQIIRSQISTFSSDRMVIDAMKLFPSAFKIYNSQLELSGNSGKQKLDLLRQNLKSYYASTFNDEYKKHNNGNGIDVESWISHLGDTAIALQHSFISANPDSMGQKDLLIDLKDNTLYNTLHKRFHPHFRDYRKQFEYSDIFLVDAESGDIVYSVSKALDFATSLKSGNFSSSSIGKVFKAAAEAEDPGFIAISDFSTYQSSYNDEAAFIASPIFDGDKKKGVLIFQIPITYITSVMTHEQQWEEVGLGQTGETYLIGEDLTLRSENRLFLQQPDQYFQIQAANGIPQSELDIIRAKHSSIGLHRIDSAASQAAIAGETGVKKYIDFRGVEVLSAYMPLSIKGLKWAVAAEITTTEAFGPIQNLQSSITWYASMLILVVLVIGALVGKMVSSIMMLPIQQTVDAIRDIAEGEGDLTQRIQIKNDDELGELARWFNRIIEKIQSMVGEMNEVTVRLNEASQQLSSVSEKTKTNVLEQQMQTQQAATATEEMSATVEEVSSHASKAASSAVEARTKSEEGRHTVEENINTIHLLTSTVDEASSVIRQLEDDSQEIGGILDVIRNIAEQTNLLALNAAIEAARAGEQGRGFAVVADEVRTLASRTQKSTQEIQQMIERLQGASHKAVDIMNQTNEQAHKGAEYASSTGEVLSSISESINQLSEMNVEIAHAAEEQSKTAQMLNKTVVDITQIGEQTAEGSQQTTSASQTLNQLSSQLQHLVGQFKI